jgi:hypothetical protein
MDYQDGYDYRNTSRDAVRKAIIINTVQCGDYAETAKFWKKIAKLTGGSYAAIARTGGMETPMDAELSKLNTMLEETVVAFGSAELKSKSASRKEKERQELKARIRDLSIKRNAYIAERLKEKPDKDSFDEIMLELIKDQAAEKGITC